MPRMVEIALDIGGSQNPDNTVGDTPQYTGNMTFCYEKIISDPGTENPTLVSSNGDIDLTQLPTSPGVGTEADLIFFVSGEIQGTDKAVYYPRWAKPGEGTGPADKPYCWLVTSETDPTVVPWPPGMRASISPDKGYVTIDDNRRGIPYFYNLGVCFDNLPGHRNQPCFVIFDPKIVNPG